MAAMMTAGLAQFAAADEPSVEVATRWWTELTNVITPVGWRDHLHRFNVVYDGTILARPPGKPPRFEGEKDPIAEGVQLTFIPSADGVIPPARTEDHSLSQPDGRRVGDQGWAGHPAPVLWTRWKTKEGIDLRQTVFAHMQGGGESQTGIEPMFAWIRLEVVSATTQQCGFLIKLNAPHIGTNMLEAKNLMVQPGKSTYPRTLRFDEGHVIEEDDRVRLAVLPGGAGGVKFTPRAGDGHDSYLHVTFPAASGAHVDLLLPMIRAERATFDKEMALGWDGALTQANAFWSPRPSTAATIHTPEPLINAAIENSVRLTRMLSITIPATRQKTLISGSMVYSLL